MAMILASEKRSLVMERKAQRCVKIAKAMLKPDACTSELEDLAIDLMELSDKELVRQEERFNLQHKPLRPKGFHIKDPDPLVRGDTMLFRNDGRVTFLQYQVEVGSFQFAQGCLSFEGDKHAASRVFFEVSFRNTLDDYLKSSNPDTKVRGPHFTVDRLVFGGFFVTGEGVSYQGDLDDSAKDWFENAFKPLCDSYMKTVGHVRSGGLGHPHLTYENPPKED